MDSILLHSALESMSDGFTVWDDNLNLISFNKKCEEMYFSKVSGLKIGMSLKEVCKLAIQNGHGEGISAPAMFKKYSAILKKTSKTGKNQFYECEIKGRFLRITFMQAIGVGYIIIQKDITNKIKQKQFEEKKDHLIATQNFWVAQAIDSMSQGLCAFDKEKRLIICNKTYATIYQLPKELTQQGAKYEDILRFRISRGLIPEGETALSHLKNRLALAKVKRHEEKFIEYENGRYWQIMKNSLPDGGWVGIIQDISEEIKKKEIAKEKDQHIAEQNILINSAISNMSHGLSMFGSDHKLILSNDIYAKFYGLPKRMVRPGTDFLAILKYRLKNNMGSANESDEDFLNKRLEFTNGEPKAIEIIEEVGNRLIYVIRKPMKHGGWVATHQDITEQRQREEIIEKRSDELLQQNMRFDAAVNNMSHGLALFDKDNKLVICNQPYIDLYELPEELTKPGTSFWTLLDHDAKFGRVSIADKKQRFEILSEVLKTDKPISGPITMLNGQIIYMNHHPMDDGSWMTIHEDITEKYQKEELIAQRTLEIEQQNVRFDAAINNMGHGLSMFDKNHKLVICNEAYKKLYKLPKNLSEPGADFWEILEHGAKSNMVSIKGKNERYEVLNKIIKDKKIVKGPVTMLNGKTLYIQHLPMQDGGWLATHEDITEQHKSEELIRHMAKHDGLTGLLNRRAFHEIMLEGEEKIKAGKKMAVFCVDLDNFKQINDSFGHSAGDAVLKIIAKRIKKCVGKQGTVARFGGDEFAIFIGPITNIKKIENIAKKIVTALAKPVCWEKVEVIVGSSIGIAISPQHGSNSQTLMHNADLATYYIKNNGRGNYCFFETSMAEKQKKRIDIEVGLKTALKKNQLQLYYQPLISLKTNKISCCEALMRWRPNNGKNYSPMEFIPVAEETGLIREMGNWALNQACNSAVLWANDVRVAVNVSPIQFSSDELLEQVSNALNNSGLEPNRLELEITESVSLDENDRNLQILHKLKAMGVRIALDDFGTGFSSLSYLRSFPFDKVKLDRSFISSLDEKPESIAIIKAVVDIGASLGMSVTTEGIETEEQLRAVYQQNCDEVQGYLFSPPLPQSSIEKLLVPNHGKLVEADKKIA